MTPDSANATSDEPHRDYAIVNGPAEAVRFATVAIRSMYAISVTNRANATVITSETNERQGAVKKPEVWEEVRFDRQCRRGDDENRR